MQGCKKILVFEKNNNNNHGLNLNQICQFKVLNHGFFKLYNPDSMCVINYSSFQFLIVLNIDSLLL